MFQRRETKSNHTRAAHCGRVVLWGLRACIAVVRERKVIEGKGVSCSYYAGRG